MNTSPINPAPIVGPGSGAPDLDPARDCLACGCTRDDDGRCFTVDCPNRWDRHRLALTDAEHAVVINALAAYHDNLLDDQHEGGDHGDEIDTLETLNERIPFINSNTNPKGHTS